MTGDHITVRLATDDGINVYGEASTASVIADALAHHRKRLADREEAIRRRMTRSVVPGGHGRSHTALIRVVHERARLERLLGSLDWLERGE